MQDTERLHLLTEWVRAECGGHPFTLSPASSDASFRRYFRITPEEGKRSLIVMDAPPQHEDCRPFLQVARLFAASGVHVPDILAQNPEQGFLLLSDLGSTTYFQALSEDPADAGKLYGDAVSALLDIQRASRHGVLPDYSGELLLREMNLFPDWYMTRHLQKTLSASQQSALASVFACIVQNNLAQPKVFVHRDYHSRNLMVTAPNPGVIDFQDAVYGPVTYDLVSLFRDAYLCWDEEQVLDWVIRYWEKARKAGLPVTTDFSAFYRDFEWMGVQRHIKVLGIFARLYHRDGKAGYLADMPRVMAYLRKACERYAEFDRLLYLLDELEGGNPEEKIGYTF